MVLHSAARTVGYLPARAGEDDETFTLALSNASGGRPSATAPAISGVAGVSELGKDDTYDPGDVSCLRVTFDAAVDATSSPRLTIDMDRVRLHHPVDEAQGRCATTALAGRSHRSSQSARVGPSASRCWRTRWRRAAGRPGRRRPGATRSSATTRRARVDWRPAAATVTGVLPSLGRGGDSAESRCPPTRQAAGSFVPEQGGSDCGPYRAGAHSVNPRNRVIDDRRPLELPG